MKKYRAKVKIELLSILGGKCVVCGSMNSLQIDHINPKNKKFNLARNWTRNREESIEELKKCQILCKYHHDIKTNLEWVSKRKHGTVSMYKKWKCRCRPCTDAAVAEVRKYRK